jgi:hypothetical protein
LIIITHVLFFLFFDKCAWPIHKIDESLNLGSILQKHCIYLFCINIIRIITDLFMDLDVRFIKAFSCRVPAKKVQFTEHLFNCNKSMKLGDCVEDCIQTQDQDLNSGLKCASPTLLHLDVCFINTANAHYCNSIAMSYISSK